MAIKEEENHSQGTLQIIILHSAVYHVLTAPSHNVEHNKVTNQEHVRSKQ